MGLWVWDRHLRGISGDEVDGRWVWEGYLRGIGGGVGVWREPVWVVGGVGGVMVDGLGRDVCVFGARCPGGILIVSLVGWKGGFK